MVEKNGSTYIAADPPKSAIDWISMMINIIVILQ